MLKKIDEQRYKGISTVLEEELSQLEDSKKIMIKQIDDLDSQKEWVDWISKYGDDISKQFKNPTTTLLEGIISKIIVSPVLGETREGWLNVLNPTPPLQTLLNFLVYLHLFL